MKVKLFIMVFMLVFASMRALAQNGMGINFPPTQGLYSKRPHIQPTILYNSSTTTLTVKMPSITSGKVEIYRNGAKVVDASIPANATLNFVLRNYGKGNYTVVVSRGNTVVYCRSMNVK